MPRKIDRAAVWVIAGCCALYVLISLSSWHEPIMGDEVNFINASRSLNDMRAKVFFTFPYDGVFGIWHPPAYVHLINLVTNILGTSAMTLRITGIVSFFLSVVILYALSLRLLKGDPRAKPTAFLACLLYCLNPLAVRGSLLVDIDGTILNASLLLLIYLLAKESQENLSPGRYLFYGIVCALVFWTKLSGPLIFFASTLMYSLAARDFKKMVPFITIAALGGIFFLATWYLYCQIHNRNFVILFRVPLQVLGRLFEKSGTQGKTMSLLRNIWAPVMWASPSFLLLALISIGKICKQKRTGDALISIKHFAFYGACVAICYVFTGGVTHSFPKYHYAMMPIFAITVAYLLMNEMTLSEILMKHLAMVIFILVVFYLLFTGDPLYTVNYAWKEDAILNAGRLSRQILKKEALQIILILLTIPLTCLFFMLRKFSKPLLLALCTTALAWNLSLSLIQISADYNTVYCYGAKGVKNTAEFIRTHTNVYAPIFSPTEIIVLANENLNSYAFSGPQEKALQGPEQFIQEIKKNGIQCVAYGIASNTISQYERIFNKIQVQEFLRDRYIPYDIGSYKIWILKDT